MTHGMSPGKPITNDQLERLLNFVGYGSLDANVWFLGMEEAGGGEENIRTRLQFRTVEDNANAHKLLGVTKHHSGKRSIQPTWRGMCYIMLRLEGQAPTRENLRTYQAEKLGRFNSNTLLTELMPIPKPKISHWGYNGLLPQFTSREDYYRQIKPRRVQYLRQIIAENQPKAIIGYGKGFWPEYKNLFPGVKFSANGRFQTANDGTTKIILTDHFTARTMNGKFDDVVSILQRN